MKKFQKAAIAAIMACGVVIVLSIPLNARLKGAPVPFSADWAHYEDGQRLEGGKLHASSEGIRLEGSAGGESFVMIFNFNRGVAWSVIDAERMYIETAVDGDELGMGEIGQFGMPCPPEAVANRIGSEDVNGRNTEKWTCDVPGEGIETVWYDTRLQMPIRSEDEDGRFALTNIKEGSQPASLFIPPPGYTKLEVPSF
ncbi:hypothetical protein [Desulfobulbus alkaliphilus]|uniref:hypothetical protein n=1 Tax=Desulfobulbus alkaliphilus TaxID=869814 RepID=UPI0019654655|nr:hypothetical protein [Desulfobulbus alkaliphilus]MBM9536686.1 hypothetical protein [Desulfobulbus alkaliphilus]